MISLIAAETFFDSELDWQLLANVVCVWSAFGNCEYIEVCIRRAGALFPTDNSLLAQFISSPNLRASALN